jgi:hypothetical protein
MKYSEEMVLKCPYKERIEKLERTDYEMGLKINNLIERVDKLIITLQKIAWYIIPTVLSGIFTLLAFLVVYWVKN